MRQCSNCGGKGQSPEYYCFTCKEPGCATLDCQEHLSCWQRHLPGDALMRRKHRPIDPLAEVYVNAVTFSEADADEQAKLHQRDSRNQWFMVQYNGQDWEDQQPWISVTDRFRQLCDPLQAGNRHSATQYPSFVSFIGDTGVGKSTLLRAMVMMGQLNASTDASEDEVETFQKLLAAKRHGPVTRSANTDNLTDPTSSGVHLYKDITALQPDPVQLQARGQDSNGPQTRALAFRPNPGFDQAQASQAVPNSQNTASSAFNPLRMQSGIAPPDPALSQAQTLWPDRTGTLASHEQVDSIHYGSEPPSSGLSHGQAQRPGESLLAGSASSSPMLFADCEGFRGSTALTNSERALANRSQLPRSEYIVMEKPIKALSIREKQGKEGAEVFYARFLYAVSDVLVFVTKSDQMLHGDLQRLMEWAASAINNSVNNAIHKTLIVVRNMPELHSPVFYNPKDLENSLFKSLKPLWEGSSILQNFIRKHNSMFTYDEQKIHDNKDLFDRFFKSHCACYIPSISKAPVEEVYRQYHSLRTQIDQASALGQDLRRKSWTQYNVPTLTHLLNRAFEHFRMSDKPFDFYTAARKDNPNPTSPADHIANFLSRTWKIRDTRASMFTAVVSVALVGYVLRNFEGTPRDPGTYFERELKEFCRQSLAKFGDKYQSCAFGFEGLAQTACIVKRPVHVEHCNQDGVRRPGEFVDEMCKVRDSIMQAICDRFFESFHGICGRNRSALPTPKDASRQREEVLGAFAQQWKSMKSNRTCFACLYQVPDHVLPCGHSLCGDCVVEYGQPSSWFESCFKLSRCPLCQTSWAHNVPAFHLKPKCAGVRVLTLDGGGIRGVMELAVLEHVMAKFKVLGIDVPIRELFDLIMGTSTGGIIALGLATRGDLTVHGMREKFMDLAKQTFRARRAGRVVTLLDPLQWIPKTLLLLRIKESVYRTKPLKEGLQDLFTRDRLLFSGGPDYREPRITRVAVTSAKDEAATACIITNYNRPQISVKAPLGSLSWRSNLERWNGDYSNADFEREDREDNEMKIWEAGLATSAAPFYFKPFNKAETNKDYVDGALHANLPISYSLSEIKKIWPELGSAPPDVLVSVGTGLQVSELDFPDVLDIGGLKKLCKSYHQNLDTGRMWREFCESHKNDHYLMERIHRLNAKIDPPYAALDKHDRMADLADMVSKQMQSPSSPLAEAVARVANVLIASLFFFEPLSSGEGDAIEHRPSESRPTFRLRGTICCKLARGSMPVKQLARHVLRFAHKELAGDGSNDGDRDGWLPLPFADEVRHSVQNRDGWLRVPVQVLMYEEEPARQVIAVVLRGREEETPIPISGFPVTLSDLRARAGIAR